MKDVNPNQAEGAHWGQMDKIDPKFNLLLWLPL